MPPACGEKVPAAVGPTGAPSQVQPPLPALQGREARQEEKTNQSSAHPEILHEVRHHHAAGGLRGRTQPPSVFSNATRCPPAPRPDPLSLLRFSPNLRNQTESLLPLLGLGARMRATTKGGTPTHSAPCWPSQAVPLIAGSNGDKHRNRNDKYERPVSAWRVCGPQHITMPAMTF